MVHSVVNLGIDTIQLGKKQFISTFVTHQPLADVLTKMVDIQTKYTKDFADNMIQTSLDLASTMMATDYFSQFTKAIKTK